MLVESLGGEDPLEKGMAIHYSILAWKIPRTGEPGWLQSMGLQRVGHKSVTKQQQQNSLLRVMVSVLSKVESECHKRVKNQE